MIHRDRLADEDHARRDRPALGAGDDDLIVAADPSGRGREVARVQVGRDEPDPRVVVGVKVQIRHGVDSRPQLRNGDPQAPGAWTTKAASSPAIR